MPENIGATNLAEKLRLISELWSPRVVAERECHVLLIEPCGTVNTGNAESDLRAEDDVWV